MCFSLARGAALSRSAAKGREAGAVDLDGMGASDTRAALQADATRLADRAHALQARIARRRRAWQIEATKLCAVMFPRLALPNFRTAAMTTRAGRLSVGISKQLGLMSFHKFEHRLYTRGSSDPRFVATPTIEHNSTRMCLWCGTINFHVGASHIFMCRNPACRHRGDRDREAHDKINLADIIQSARYFDEWQSSHQPASSTARKCFVSNMLHFSNFDCTLRSCRCRCAVAGRAQDAMLLGGD